MIQLKIKVKLILTVEGHVMPVQLVMMEFKIKMNLTSIVEGHALIAVRTNIVLLVSHKDYFCFKIVIHISFDILTNRSERKV